MNDCTYGVLHLVIMSSMEGMKKFGTLLKGINFQRKI